MPNTIWELPVRRDAKAGGEVIGVVVFRGDDIVGFVSDYDFRDTDFSGAVSVWEKIAGYVGVHRSIFVSTAIKELQNAILDPNIPAFDYNQINQIRYTNMTSAAVSVGTELLLDVAINAFVGHFTTPILQGIIGRFTSDVIPTMLFTALGERIVEDLTSLALSTTPGDTQYAGYTVSYVAADPNDSRTFNPDDGTDPADAPMIVFATARGSIAVGGTNDDIVVAGDGASVDLTAGGDNDVSLTVSSSRDTDSRVVGGSGLDRLTLSAVEGERGAFFVRLGGSGQALFGANAAFADVEAFAARDGEKEVMVYYNWGSGLTIASTTISGIEQISYDGTENSDLFVASGDAPRIIGNGGSNTLYADWRGQTAGVTWDLNETAETAATLANGWTVQGIHRLLARLGDGNNHITLNGGNNVIYGGAGDDTILSGGTGDTLDGGGGLNHLSYAQSTGGVTIDLTTGRGFGGYAQGDIVSNISRITGSDHSDVIRGDAQNNHLFGGSGDDTIHAGAGNDLVRGGDGDDQIVAGTGTNYLAGDAGDDSITLIGSAYYTAQYAAYNVSSATQTGTGQRINLNGKAMIEAVIDGGADLNTIYLGDEGDAFFLHDAYSGFHESLALTPDYVGNYSMQRFINIQRIFGMDGGDIIDLTSPDYSLAGASIMIDGGEGNDVIWGSDASETIYGGAGDDTIFGGIGADELYGGTGADVFEFTKTSTDTTAADFNPSEGDLLRFYNRDGAQFEPESIGLTDDGIRIAYSESGTTHEIDVALAASTADFNLSLQQILSATEFV